MREEMVFYIGISRLQADRGIILTLLAILWMVLVEGLETLSNNQNVFPLPILPGTEYYTTNIFVIPEKNFPCTLTLYSTYDQRTVVSRNVSLQDNFLWLTDDSESYAIRSGFVLLSSAPVDILISVNDSYIPVISINQLGASYLFTSFYSRSDEMCEKLFIYTVNNAAEVDMCWDNFLQTNVSHLVDREIINQKPSEKCVKLALSSYDGSLLSDLSGVSRLQITSNRPVGILYGLGSPSVDNKSCFHSEEKDELIDWQVLPPITAWGKQYVVVPAEKKLETYITIIGSDNATVRLQSSGNQTVYNLAAKDILFTSVKTDHAVIIQSNTSILILINETRHETFSNSYFAQPVDMLINTPLNKTENVSAEEATAFVTIQNNTKTVPVLCSNNSVNVSLDKILLMPSRTMIVTALQFPLLYIMYFAIPDRSLTVLRYPRSVCLVLGSQVKSVGKGFQLQNPLFGFEGSTKNKTTSALLETREPVLLSNKSVINLTSALRNTETKNESSYKTNGQNILNNSSNNTEREADNGAYKFSLSPESPMLGKDILNFTERLNAQTMAERRTHIYHRRKEGNIRSKLNPISHGLDSLTNTTANNLIKTANSVTTGPVIEHVKPYSPTKISSVVSTLNMTLGAFENPTSEQEATGDDLDVNKAFKMVVDIIHTENGKVINILDSHENTGVNQIIQQDTDKYIHPNNNPPYAIDTDMFFKLETDLDGKNSMAVIISLSAALVAVVAVILIFFFVEVFSRRRYIRNTRIRPSVSFY